MGSVDDHCVIVLLPVVVRLQEAHAVEEERRQANSNIPGTCLFNSSCYRFEVLQQGVLCCCEQVKAFNTQIHIMLTMQETAQRLHTQHEACSYSGSSDFMQFCFTTAESGPHMVARRMSFSLTIDMQ